MYFRSKDNKLVKFNKKLILISQYLTDYLNEYPDVDIIEIPFNEEEILYFNRFMKNFMFEEFDSSKLIKIFDWLNINNTNKFFGFIKSDEYLTVDVDMRKYKDYNKNKDCFEAFIQLKYFINDKLISNVEFFRHDEDYEEIDNVDIGIKNDKMRIYLESDDENSSIELYVDKKYQLEFDKIILEELDFTKEYKKSYKLN